MRSHLASLVLAVVLGAMTTGSVLAMQPTREFAPPPDGIVDSSCGFDVLVNFPVQREYATTFFSRDGEVVMVNVTGALTVRFTNIASGATLTLNISGPTHFNLRSGNDSGEGLTGGPVLGLDGLNWFAGRVDYNSGDRKGRLLLSVCEALAS